MSVEEVLARLQGVKHTGRGWMALCPAHADKNRSLSVREENGRVLLYCFAGCTLEAVLSTLGIEVRELLSDGNSQARIEREYDYLDENAKLLFQVVRYEPKAFKQRRPDGNGGWQWNLNGVRRVLYRLPEVLVEKSLLICEGEKDCEVARALGLVATCNPGGAGKWREEYSEHLGGKQITIIADADEPGRRHAQQVAASISVKAESSKLLELPGAKDLTEWVEKGGTRDALLELIRNAPERKPASEQAQPGAVLRCIADIEKQELLWLWPGRIPLGKLTLLIGDPGLGKSLVTIDIGSRVTRGSVFPDGAPCESGSVIILSAEDDAADTIRPRLEAASADISRVHVLEAVRVQLSDGSLTEKAFSLETDVAHLEAVLRAHPDVRLIVIDPVSAYLGGVDSHSNAEVRGLLTPLAKLAASYRVSVLCVTHLRKSAGPAVHRAIASIAFAATARAAWAVAPDPEGEDRKLLVQVKQNLSASIGGLAFRIEAPSGTATVAWESGAVALPANEVLNVDYREDHSERKAAEEWLRDYLADGPAAAGQAIRAAHGVGFSTTTLRRAATSLRVKTRKLGGRGAGWEWRLEDSTAKESTPIRSNSVSLDSLSNPLKTKLNSETGISKNPRLSTTESLESLPVHGASERLPDGRERCLACGHVFGSFAGWRAHIVRNRCDGEAPVWGPS